MHSRGEGLGEIGDGGKGEGGASGHKCDQEECSILPYIPIRAHLRQAHAY